MPPITVYTAGPNCQPCRLTKRHLQTKGIPFTEKPLTAAGQLAEGLKTAPVVQAGTEVWDGYRPSRIDALLALP